MPLEEASHGSAYLRRIGAAFLGCGDISRDETKELSDKRDHVTLGETMTTEIAIEALGQDAYTVGARSLHRGRRDHRHAGRLLARTWPIHERATRWRRNSGFLIVDS